MSTFQKVIICGNVGQDPEIKSFNNGGKIANLSVATSESWKDKASGEKRERTEWHRVTINSPGLVGIVERYVKKGDKILIEGKLQTRKWKDRDGNDRYTTEVSVGFGGTLTMLGGGKSGKSGNSGRGGYDQGSSSSGGGDFEQSQSDFTDDEIPFS